MVSITPFAAPAASRSETIRFGSLEFPAIPRDGSWVPPPFPPSQTFRFGSLEFVTDQLIALRLHEEEFAPPTAEESAPPPKLHKLSAGDRYAGASGSTDRHSQPVWCSAASR